MDKCRNLGERESYIIGITATLPMTVAGFICASVVGVGGGQSPRPYPL